MTPRARKLAYALGAAALLAVVAVLCQPATVGGPGSPGSPGGTLSQMRGEYRLRQSGLGKVDASSETMKLATFGLRPVAVAALWARADIFRKKEDWTNLQTTLDVILKLQPNFVEVWRTQSWNIAYNVSAECDDYKMRYAWVMAGIRLLEEGESYNRFNTKLLWEQGFTIAQKIGRSDERKYFRRFFIDDEEFHKDRPRRRDRDNFLVAKERYRAAESAHTDEGQRIQGQSPLVFWGSAPKCQIDYASVLQKETTTAELDDKTRLETFREYWRQAQREYVDGFGSTDIPTGDGTIIHLNDRDRLAARALELNRLLDPGGKTFQALREEKLARLPAPLKAVLAKAAEDRTTEERQLANQAEQVCEVSHAEIAERAPAEKLAAARQIADEATDLKRRLQLVDIYRTTVNFDYWGARCDAEMTDDALQARDLLLRGEKALEDLDVATARRLVEDSFVAWRKVLDSHKDINEDVEISNELADAIRRYKERILDQFDAKFPAPFVLQDIVDLRDPFRVGPQRPPPRENKPKESAANSK